MNARLDLEPMRWRSDPPLQPIDAAFIRANRRRRDDRDKLWIGASIGLAVAAIVLSIYLGV